MTRRTFRERFAANGLRLTTPFPSIPQIAALDQYDIEFWIWTKEDADRHHVFIERRDGIMIAGVHYAGERLIAGMWREIHGNPFGAVLDYCGKYAVNMNAELVDEEITERIWDFIQRQAISMKLRIVFGKDGRRRDQCY